MQPERINYNVPIHKSGNETVTIVGNYWKGDGEKGVVLLHMMPSTKESWNDFTVQINKSGYHVLAIDLRGHGESIKVSGTNEKNLNYKEFTDKEHQAYEEDVLGARNFLLEKNISSKNLVIGGASIGANLTAQYMNTFPETKKGLMLSPGLDYYGVPTEKYIKNLGETQRVFLSAAENDEYSFESSKTLYEKNSEKITFEKFSGEGKRTHGTDLFTVYPELQTKIINWIEE